jgi:hypothetical protein
MGIPIDYARWARAFGRCSLQYFSPQTRKILDPSHAVRRLTGERTARPLTRSPSPTSVAIAGKRALAAIGKAVRISDRGSLRVRASPNLSRGACYRRHDQHAGDCDPQNVSHGSFLEMGKRVLPFTVPFLDTSHHPSDYIGRTVALGTG